MVTSIGIVLPNFTEKTASRQLLESNVEWHWISILNNILNLYHKMEVVFERKFLSVWAIRDLKLGMMINYEKCNSLAWAWSRVLYF